MIDLLDLKFEIVNSVQSSRIEQLICDYDLISLFSDDVD